jgi:hypothetical protein
MFFTGCVGAAAAGIAPTASANAATAIPTFVVVIMVISFR